MKHILLLVAGWCIFGAAWWVVSKQDSQPLANIIWLTMGALIMLPIITLYWVLHNRGIYSRKGPRQQTQVIESAYTHDWAGRPVRANFTELKQARTIVIDSNSDEKFFRSEALQSSSIS